MTQQWKLVPARATKAMQDAWDTAPFNDDTDVEFHGAYAAMIAAAPASALPERDWELTCDHCDGDGFVYVERRVGPCATDIQTFKEDCECCEGRGFTIAFADIPGIAGYVKSCRSAPASAQDDAKDDILRWIMREAEAAKEPCGDNPESATAVRNAKLAAISGAAAQALGLVRGPSYAAPAAGDARDALSLFECMTIARRGFEHWAAKPHNRRWFKKIDGTPISNDLPVCIADEFKEAIDAALAASQQQEG